MPKKEKDWLPDVRKLMQIVQHQKQRMPLTPDLLMD